MGFGFMLANLCQSFADADSNGIRRERLEAGFNAVPLQRFNVTAK
jgi:hypothetical protein